MMNRQQQPKRQKPLQVENSHLLEKEVILYVGRHEGYITFDTDKTFFITDYYDTSYIGYIQAIQLIHFALIDNKYYQQTFYKLPKILGNEYINENELNEVLESIYNNSIELFKQ